MRLQLLDRSNYYKGLLILIGRDRIVDPRERELMLQLGKMLDFDKRFCEAAMDELLGNAYLTDEPVVFSKSEIAECFIRDALRLAYVDEEFHPKEQTWLKAMARANGVADEWFEVEVKQFPELKNSLTPSSRLDIERLL